MQRGVYCGDHSQIKIVKDPRLDFRPIVNRHNPSSPRYFVTFGHSTMISSCAETHCTIRFHLDFEEVSYSSRYWSNSRRGGVFEFFLPSIGHQIESASIVRFQRHEDVNLGIDEQPH